MLERLSRHTIEEQGIFHYPYVNNLIEEQLTRRKDNREPLWTLLVFQIWFDAYMKGNTAEENKACA